MSCHFPNVRLLAFVCNWRCIVLFSPVYVWPLSLTLCKAYTHYKAPSVSPLQHTCLYTENSPASVWNILVLQSATFDALGHIQPLGLFLSQSFFKQILELESQYQMGPQSVPVCRPGTDFAPPPFLSITITRFICLKFSVYVSDLGLYQWPGSGLCLTGLLMSICHAVYTSSLPLHVWLAWNLFLRMFFFLRMF